MLAAALNRIVRHVVLSQQNERGLANKIFGDYAILAFLELRIRPRSQWRNTRAIRKGETTRNPGRNLHSSCEKTRRGSGFEPGRL
jgi:hypothetical protein